MTEKNTAESANSEEKQRWHLSRRRFLIGAGLAGGGLALGYLFGVPAARLRIAESTDEGGGGFFSQSNEPLAWFEVKPDSSITLYVPKVEMGQGVHTALKQIAVEELGAPWDTVTVMQGTTSLGPQDSSGTQGSTSVSSSFTPLREAAATLREMLRLEAVVQLKTPSGSLLSQGAGFTTTGGKSITFGEIVSNKVDAWEVPEGPAPLKSVSEYETVGQSITRGDIPGKVTGEAVYGYDVKLPGMKFGAVLRPPTIEGQLKSVDATTAEQMPGVVKVVVADDFAGLVANSRIEAWAALNELQAEWDEGKLWQQEELEELVTAGGPGGVTIQKKGNANRALNGGNVVAAEYRTPLMVQTPLEAQAALADVREDGARIWASTQAQSRVQELVSKATGLDQETIEVVPTLLGGGFGRKLGDVAVEAARLSKVSGVPVHLGWNRPEELRHGFFAPLSHHRLQATLDPNGRIQAIKHELGSGDILFAFFSPLLTAVFGADIGVSRGARIEYDVPDVETVIWRRKLPVKTGSWRGLGFLPNVFAVESFMDELANEADIDPLQFRLMNLPGTERGRKMGMVLEAATNGANWGGSLPDGRAQGLACAHDFGTSVAAVAEVSVDEATGKIRVHHITSAMDCGLVINPDGAKAQMEGNAMWGVSATLTEEVRIENGRVALNNFETYPLLTLKEAPTVEAILVDTGGQEPTGVGEPPIGPVGAAIANAVFSLTGQRLRNMPLSLA
ncbi:MAG: molybdopterin cofactor-binding domain-containing protein [Candidatus Promineifilaceae bacterium]